MLGSPRRSLGCPLRGGRGTDQLVQLSVAGVVVEVPDPPVAVTPVRDGREKNVAAHAAGVVAAMLASFVNVTASGLFACPLAPTTSGVVSVCELPLVAVEKFHVCRGPQDLVYVAVTARSRPTTEVPQLGHVLRGSDIVKAVAMGVDAVAIGKPMI